jgi:site-specific recombinase XerC
MDIIPKCNPREPIFPELYADTEKRLNYRLVKPRKYMQTLLKLKNRPPATLHSFRVTFNNTLRDMGLSIEDRQILLAHASSETTKIYTHPNFDLATSFVDRIPNIGKRNQNVTK